MNMQRWILERDGLVRGYLLTKDEPTEAEKRALVFGESDDGERDLAEEGTWRRAPDDLLVGDGWLFDGKTYSPPVLPVTVPESVSRFQARAALAMAGLLPAVDAAIAESGNVIAQIAWADAQTFQRNSPTVLAMSRALGLTEQQIDALFISASTIEA